MFDTFNKDSKKDTLYVSLYKHIKKMIKENKYQEGQKLPSKRRLAEDLHISPLTVEAAYQQLIAEGYVYAIEKKGYYVDEQIELVESHKKNIKFKSQNDAEVVPEYQYAFRTNVVDTSLFPNTTWARLSREVLSENHHEMLNVTHPQGVLMLRKEIAKYLELYRGMNVSEEQIIIGSGSSSLISILIELLGRDKHYAIENPGYSKNYALYKGNDVRLSLISLDDSGIKIDDLIQSNAEIVHITPSHQFPMGIVMPIQRRIELLNWSNRFIGRYIIEDDYDSEFRFQGKPIPALQGFYENDQVIYMNTFARTLAPSFRMSYMVLPLKLLPRYHQIMTYHGCTVPNSEQYIMYKFMHGGFFERHINRMRNQYRQKIELILKMVENYPNVRLKGYDAGLHFLMEIETNDTEASLIEKVAQHHIYVTGLSSYDHKIHSSHSNPTLVIGYSGIKKEEIEQSISALFQSINISKS
ncbi:MAG: PLP-dependent aminotransferase family protein [Firmicutes bacterium]|nr:PLP-dependent aminotransferase family protein [Bacillota bacterium]